jgi:glycine oxidase
VRTWDVVIVGGGIIGLSLGLGLRKHGATVLIVDKAEPGREASSAAAGMLAYCEQADSLKDLAFASATLYPEYVTEIEDASGQKVDYRTEGTIVLPSGDEDEPVCDGAVRLTTAELVDLEPGLSFSVEPIFLPEASVDPRALAAVALKAAHHHGIDVSSGNEVIRIDTSNLGVDGVSTTKTRFPAGMVVNCAGAWSGQFQSPLRPPTRPVKGHMLDLIPAANLTSTSARPLLQHVVRTPEVYLVPRSDGRIIVGATVEEAGFDKRVNPDTIQHLFQAAANVCPELGEAKIHESWCGLRPGSPDNLPMLGATDTQGYFIATGHFRDGILLAPITAQVMTQVIRGERCPFDLSAFSPLRFSQ